MQKKYLIVDHRALEGLHADYTVFEVCDSSREAMRNRKDYGENVPIIVCEEEGNVLTPIELLKRSL